MIMKRTAGHGRRPPLPPRPLGRPSQERNKVEDHVRSRSHFSSVLCTQCASGTKHETRQVQSPDRRRIPVQQQQQQAARVVWQAL